jgi:membrane fusion protein (multidrug efflux system)
MTKKVIFSVLLVVVVVVGLAGVKALQFSTLLAAAKSYAQPPESVSAVTTKAEKWQGTLTAIGSITAVQGVTVSTEIAGTIREIAFESGAVVTNGQLLVRLDTSSEEAQLRSLEAQEEWANINLDRAKTLSDQKMISQSDYESAIVAMKQAKANADAMRATIEKKTIRAPFAGRLGIRQINLGQYLDTGKPIVSLQSLTPVYANFSLPQQELARLKEGMPVRVSTDAFPDRRFEGSLTAINPDLDSSTRSIGLQATFANTDQLLRPGMFVRTEVLLPEQQDVIVVPATAVLSSPYGESVFIIESKTNAITGKTEAVVRQQFIRSGPGRGDFVSIETGLKPGERVVSSGVFKLRNGLTVVEHNELVPKTAVAPKPSDS